MNYENNILSLALPNLKRSLFFTDGRFHCHPSYRDPDRSSYSYSCS